jgi:hypothetical protein
MYADRENTGSLLITRSRITLAIKREPVRGQTIRAPYPADRKPFPFRREVWLPCDYGTTT